MNLRQESLGLLIKYGMGLCGSEPCSCYQQTDQKDVGVCKFDGEYVNINAGCRKP